MFEKAQRAAEAIMCRIAGRKNTENRCGCLWTGTVRHRILRPVLRGNDRKIDRKKRYRKTIEKKRSGTRGTDNG